MQTIIEWRYVSNLPPRDWNDYYKNNFSIQVLLGNTKQNTVWSGGWRWDYRHNGWVNANFDLGCRKFDYIQPDADIWAEWPTLGAQL